jgi:hypothetical protein
MRPASQRTRWTVAERTVAALEAALHLVTVPFSLAVLSLVAGAALLAAGALVAAVVPFALLLLLAGVLCLGLLQVRAPAGAWLALLAAPVYVLFKVWVQCRALATVLRRDRSFPATPRA